MQKDKNSSIVLSYEELLTKLAMDCEGFSGAAIASVARAAASRALERAVEQLADDLEQSSDDNESGTGPNIMNCLVTQEDFDEALDDVRGSMGSHDHTEDDADDLAKKDDDTEKETEEDN
jgi:SpoVK/Ycf46/Vps4 family AAA+-type ATPase